MVRPRIALLIGALVVALAVFLFVATQIEFDETNCFEVSADSPTTVEVPC